GVTISYPFGLIPLTTLCIGRPKPSKYCVLCFTSCSDRLEEFRKVSLAYGFSASQIRTKFIVAPLLYAEGVGFKVCVPVPGCVWVFGFTCAKESLDKKAVIPAIIATILSAFL